MDLSLSHQHYIIFKKKRDVAHEEPSAEAQLAAWLLKTKNWELQLSGSGLQAVEEVSKKILNFLGIEFDQWSSLARLPPFWGSLIGWIRGNKYFQVKPTKNGYSWNKLYKRERERKSHTHPYHLVDLTYPNVFFFFFPFSQHLKKEKEINKSGQNCSA